MLGFDYGQRHAVELGCAAGCSTASNHCGGLGRKARRRSILLKIPTLANISDTALTRDVAIAMGEDGLPNTFVPGRNLVF
jgi:7-cyano-7-deazaguanine synthase